MFAVDPQAFDPFVGRTAELDVLAQCFNEGEGCRLIAVHGEAGVGKSRLGQECERCLANQAVLFAWGRWYEAAGMPPYVGFVEALRELRSPARAQGGEHMGRLAEIERRLRGFGHETGPEGRQDDQRAYELFEELTQVLLEAGAASPVALVLDDLHWADESSLALLSHLVRRASAARGLLTLALWRDEQAPPGSPLANTIDALRQQRLMVDVALQGLNHRETGQLATCLLNRPLPTEAVDRLQDVTKGNPLFVKETIRHASQARQIEQLFDPVPASGWGVLDLPETVSEAIRLRFSQVSPNVRETLSLLSVLGREFEFGLLESCGFLGEQQLSESVPEAFRLAFLTERRAPDALRIAFSHPLVGATLYQSLDAVSRSALHRQVARALEAMGPTGHESEIAHHLIEGQRIEDRPRALRYLVEAARRARAVFAHREARRLWRRAFDILEVGVRVSDLERRIWAREFADTCSSAGYPDEALDLYGRLLGELEPDGDPAAIADLYGAMGWTLHIHGRRAEMAKYLERAVPPSGVPPSHRAASLLAAHAVGLLSSGQLVQGRPFLDRALDMAQRHPEIGAQGIVSHLAVVWHTWDPGGDPSLVPQLIEAGERCFREEGNVWSATRLQIDAAVSFFFLGDVSRCRRYLEAAIESSRRIGSTAFEADALAFSSYVASIAGDWKVAEADATRCEAYLQSAGSSIYGEGLRRGAALRHFWQGRFAEARAELEKVDSFLNASLEPHLKLAEGDPEGAAAAVEAIAPMVPADGHGGVWLMFALSSASALCTLGRAEEAAQWYDALKRHAAWHMDWWQPEIELGRIAAGNGRWREAFQHFEKGIEYFDGLGWRSFATIAHLEHAEARARRHRPGDRQRALDLAETAAEAFGTLDMSSPLAGAETLVHRLRTGRPLSAGPYGLSSREREILALIAEGLSDPEIGRRLGLSRRTVDHHVSHILSKLEVGSRAAAAVKGARLGLF